VLPRAVIATCEKLLEREKRKPVGEEGDVRRRATLGGDLRVVGGRIAGG